MELKEIINGVYSNLRNLELLRDNVQELYNKAYSQDTSLTDLELAIDQLEEINDLLLDVSTNLEIANGDLDREEILQRIDENEN